MPRVHQLSVAIVCRDEEDRIREALESARFADEIVVVDSGSTDGTLDIVREYTDKVHCREWKGWKDQKSWAAAQCSHEWVLTLDADEAISDELRSEIEDILSRETVGEDGFIFPRLTRYQGRWIKHSGWYPDPKLRLYRKSRATFGGDDPHEVIQVEGKSRRLNGHLVHRTYRGIEHQAYQLARYAMVNARERHARGKRARALDILLRPGGAFLKSYVLQAGFLEGMPGLLIAAMNGYYTFLKYARLWEMDRGED